MRFVGSDVVPMAAVLAQAKVERINSRVAEVLVREHLRVMYSNGTAYVAAYLRRRPGSQSPHGAASAKEVAKVPSSDAS